MIHHIGIAGCTGRMGAMLVEAVTHESRAKLTALSTRTIDAQHPYAQLLTTDALTLVRSSDVVIDFTNPEYSMELAALCAQHHKAYVCGTTGFSEAQEQSMRSLSSTVRMVKAANFSIGVTMLQLLSRQVAAVLGEDFDCEITELHHRYKKDAPSGTALALGEAVAEGREVALADVAQRAGRDGVVGERARGMIGFHALRGGDVIGDHTVLFAGDGERIELTHKASNRSIYARGAVRAALWVMHQPCGIYSMHDVLGRGEMNAGA
ncbi:MAG: 4-hydroxy-tetrahydrodipicolinate reductase [Alphaproteobacteria bacterium]|nr:MAG: 4-hydroxy-tetrahydrodipicolinate reductase [Alphaproteobacteria bacterium]TAF13846.1 MAG: 4-hydroxy-tetrahydrodipicolinate reductase [Alphaproteobacteria bacterium]TAF41291.1 MAG: 4-hydroxy-tetrahydrodipicolinate reductase [Alphaproteobacteria bacterium]TAF76274.1 MAG: 4-hydroxy-tetrahydrodipicolinate reductase [Alphaproteobacteria bacterium]